VPVRENFFYIDLNDAPVDLVRWRYAGQDQSFRIEEGFLPDDTNPPPPDSDAGFDPLSGSLSDQVRFTAGDGRFSADGYQAANHMICMRAFEEETDRPARACQHTRGLRDRLAEQPVELFAGGGTAHGLMTYKGFARADVIDVEPVEGTPDTVVVLSKPWSPAPWEGDPIRFLMVFDRAPEETAVRTMKWPRLRVRLADGRSYLIES